MKILQEKNFIKHKIRNLPLYDKYSLFNIKKANTILDCGKDLFFLLKEHTQTKERKLKLDSMYTCKDRFCPFCNWRRQMKYSKLIYNHLQHLQHVRSYRFLFLTLTVKNCNINDLRTTIKHMQSSFNKMTRTKKFKDSIYGYLRVLEFTLEGNLSPTDYYHPHFHVLLAVPTTYFKSTSGLYLKKDDYASMWKKALGVDYTPIVDVRIIKQNKDKSANSAVIAEICKYPLKDTDISKVNNFEELTKQLKNVRNINAGGIMKNCLKKISVLDDDLVHIDDDKKDELWIIIEKLVYNFENRNGKLNYYLKN